jgi:hypothetical protein
MENAEITTAKRRRTFQVTIGPNSDVTGEKTAPNATMDVSASTLRPPG